MKKIDVLKVRVAPELREELASVAEREGTTVSAIVRRLVISWAATRAMEGRHD